MSGELARFFRTLCVVDGRDTERILRIVGGSRATLRRNLALARQLGVVIRYDRIGRTFHMERSGPFDVQALRRARFRHAGA